MTLSAERPAGTGSAEPEQLVDGASVTRVWTLDEFFALVESGILPAEERLELIEGEIIRMSPQRPLHGTSIDRVAEACRACFGPGYYVRRQNVLGLSHISGPEPDVAVVEGEIADYDHRHPETALLIVEVAITTLALDRTRKASSYAKSGIQDYWILNLVEEVVEVRREPIERPAAVFGWDYASVRIFRRGESVAPLAKPESPIRVDDVLP